MSKYYRLLDEKHKNMIVKANGKDQQRFDSQKGWIKTGILLDYFWPESDTYDMLEEISEADALASIQ